MGFLDKLAGRREPAPPEEPPAAPEPTISGVSASELLRDVSPGAGGVGQGPSSRLYNPYEGLSTSVGSPKLVFQLPEAPEFVFQEDAAVHRRSWGENLQFYTGMGYLGGAALHGIHRAPCNRVLATLHMPAACSIRCTHAYLFASSAQHQHCIRHCMPACMAIPASLTMCACGTMRCDPLCSPHSLPLWY